MTSIMTSSPIQVPDFQLTPELQDFRSFVRDYTQKHLGNAARYDAETKFPRDAVEAAAKLGLLRTTVAKEHGGTAMGNLGQSLWALGDFAEAETLLRNALSIELAHPSKTTADRARTHDNLAKVLTELNKLDEAEQHMRAALDLRIAAFPAGHPEIALGQMNLATVLSTAKRYAEAEQLLRASLASRRATFSANHPEIAVTVRQLAAVLRRQGELTEAEPLHREALALARSLRDTLQPRQSTSRSCCGTLVLVTSSALRAASRSAAVLVWATDTTFSARVTFARAISRSVFASESSALDRTTSKRATASSSVRRL